MLGSEHLHRPLLWAGLQWIAGIVLPVIPRALGGMFSRSLLLWFSLLSKIINMSKLFNPK
jgi:hypothetical protein